MNPETILQLIANKNILKRLSCQNFQLSKQTLERLNEIIKMLNLLYGENPQEFHKSLVGKFIEKYELNISDDIEILPYVLYVIIKNHYSEIYFGEHDFTEELCNSILSRYNTIVEHSALFYRIAGDLHYYTNNDRTFGHILLGICGYLKERTDKYSLANYI